MSRPVPIETICEGLRHRAGELARTLLPRGRREGTEWREATKAKGGLGDSLAVCIAGSKAGVWMHGAAGMKGDALDLIGYLATNGDKAAAVAWARRFLGIDEGGGLPSPVRAPAAVVDSPAAGEPDADAARRRNSAFRTWIDGAPLAGTPAERYLLSRGLDLTRLDFPVGSLRYHGNVYDGRSARHWPCLVAAIHHATTGRFLAIHRTFLTHSGAKAPIEAPKKTLGEARGGVISLWKGVRVDPATGKIRKNPPLARAPAGQLVNETEGIEDGLTVALAFPEERVLCGVALGKMAAIAWPESVGTSCLWRDNDAPGSPADRAFDALVAARRAAGLRVLIARPPEGTKDVNAVLMGATEEKRARG